MGIDNFRFQDRLRSFSSLETDFIAQKLSDQVISPHGDLEWPARLFGLM